MVQMLTSTKDFELVGSSNPGTFMMSTDNSRDEVVLDRYAVFRPGTAESRFMLNETDFDDISEELFEWVEDYFTTRPMKALGFKTPNQVRKGLLPDT
jgi:hypothetical protein